MSNRSSLLDSEALVDVQLHPPCLPSKRMEFQWQRHRWIERFTVGSKSVSICEIAVGAKVCPGSKNRNW